MLDIYRNNKSFIITYLIIFLIGIIVITSFDKSLIHISINQFHTSFLDYFFKYFTNVGSGYFAALIVALLLFINFRYAIITGLSSILSGIFIQLLKQFFFFNYFRPFKFFEGTYELYLVKGVEMNSFYIFPLYQHSLATLQTNPAQFLYRSHN